MESELHRIGGQNLKIPLKGKIKVEAHSGIQTRRVLLYQRELEGPCLWKQMATQNYPECEETNGEPVAVVGNGDPGETNVDSVCTNGEREPGPVCTGVSRGG